MRIALREPTLVEQVERWACETSRPVEKVLEAAVRTYLGTVGRESIYAENRAFSDRPSALSKKYRGGIAVPHQGSGTTAETALTLLRHLPPLARLRVIALAIPEVERDLAKTPSPLKSLRGLWQDLDFDITAQEIDEARREVWANFPREDF